MFAHYPTNIGGPLRLEWAAAAYERQQAQQDCWREHAHAHISWDCPYVIAAYATEREALQVILARGYGGRLSYWDRMKL